MGQNAMPLAADHWPLAAVTSEDACATRERVAFSPAAARFPRVTSGAR